jgi:TRAP-type C4-dicarboxylate transport system permease small subunit
MISGDEGRSPEATQRFGFREPAFLAAQRFIAASGKWLERLLLAICICLLTTMFLSVFTGVVIRYVITVPFPWTEEVARFCLIWFAPLAASIGARQGIHFSFQWGLIYLPAGRRYLIRQIGNCAVIAFLAMLLWQSLGLIDVMSGQTAVASGFDMRVPAFGIVVGIAVLLTIYVLEILDALLALGTGRQFSVREQFEDEKFRILRPAEVANQPPVEKF